MKEEERRMIWEKIVDLVKQYGSISRFQIAKILNISPYTVYEVIRMYINDTPGLHYHRGVLYYIPQQQRREDKQG